MVPKFTMRPEAMLAAIPMAFRVCAGDNAISFTAAAAAPKRPTVFEL
jgi:hypothetical protein